MKKLASRPEMKELHSRNGHEFIRRFGRLKTAKLENRKRGSSHYNWQGGITGRRAVICSSLEYKAWRAAVFARDEFRCVACARNTHDLHADHINPFALYPELRTELSNGRTMCKECHKQYGANPRTGKVAILKYETNGTNWVGF